MLKAALDIALLCFFAHYLMTYAAAEEGEILVSFALF